MPHPVVHHVEVEVHLGGVLGFESTAFQIDDDEAAQLEMIEKEIQIEIVATEFEVDLPADEGEAGAELDEKLAEMLHQPEFEIPLPRHMAEGEETEVVGILDDLLGQVGLGIGQGLLEIGDGLAVALVKAGFDLEREDVPRPAVFQSLRRIPEAGGGVFDFLNEDDVVEPRNGEDLRW